MPCAAGTSRLGGDDPADGSTQCLTTCNSTTLSPSCELLLGDIDIRYGSQTSLSGPSLVQIKGNIYLENMYSLQTMDFPQLTKLEGSFTLYAVSTPHTIFQTPITRKRSVEREGGRERERHTHTHTSGKSEIEREKEITKERERKERERMVDRGGV